MMGKRTDLADEAAELLGQSAEKTTQIQGVRARQYRRRCCAVTAVDVMDGAGSRAIGKPVGHYRTVDLPPAHSGHAFSEQAGAVAEELRRLLGKKQGGAGGVLVAGLGNRAVTPDAVGPRTVDHLLITRHLQRENGALSAALFPVCALAPGVLGQTGVESAELVRGAMSIVKPACVIVIDALVARRMERLCTTVQLSDTGLIPGSGIANHRAALNEDTLHVPVLAVGVPTVIEADTLAADLLERAGAVTEDVPLPGSGAVVTTKDIDARVEQMARLVGCAITMALQPQLACEDVLALTGE